MGSSNVVLSSVAVTNNHHLDQGITKTEFEAMQDDNMDCGGEDIKQLGISDWRNNFDIDEQSLEGALGALEQQHPQQQQLLLHHGSPPLATSAPTYETATLSPDSINGGARSRHVSAQQMMQQQQHAVPSSPGGDSLVESLNCLSGLTIPKHEVCSAATSPLPQQHLMTSQQQFSPIHPVSNQDSCSPPPLQVRVHPPPDIRVQEVQQQQQQFSPTQSVQFSPSQPPQQQFSPMPMQQQQQQFSPLSLHTEQQLQVPQQQQQPQLSPVHQRQFSHAASPNEPCSPPSLPVRILPELQMEQQQQVTSPYMQHNDSSCMDDSSLQSPQDPLSQAQQQQQQPMDSASQSSTTSFLRQALMSNTKGLRTLRNSIASSSAPQPAPQMSHAKSESDLVSMANSANASSHNHDEPFANIAAPTDVDYLDIDKLVNSAVEKHTNSPPPPADASIPPTTSSIDYDRASSLDESLQIALPTRPLSRAAVARQVSTSSSVAIVPQNTVLQLPNNNMKVQMEVLGHDVFNKKQVNSSVPTTGAAVLRPPPTTACSSLAQLLPKAQQQQAMAAAAGRRQETTKSKPRTTRAATETTAAAARPTAMTANQEEEGREEGEIEEEVLLRLGPEVDTLPTDLGCTRSENRERSCQNQHPLLLLRRHLLLPPCHPSTRCPLPW